MKTFIKVKPDQTVDFDMGRVLERPCFTCRGPVADQLRAENRQELNAWSARESAAYDAWEANRSLLGLPIFPGSWQQSPEFAALGPVPELIPDVGCAECDFTGYLVTDDGRALLAFLKRHGGDLT